MPEEKTIFVKMRDGLVMPVPHDTARNCTNFVCTPETPVEVILNRFTRRRLEAGDFVIVSNGVGVVVRTPKDDEVKAVPEKRKEEVIRGPK